MSDTSRQPDSEIIEQVLLTLNKCPELVRRIPPGTCLYRVQPSCYDSNPAHYNTNSDSRFADPARHVGVCYLGLTKEVAVAESFQSGQGVDNSAIPLSRLERSSLHLLRAARALYVVDVAALANRATHHKVRDIVQAKGQGGEGYALTQTISQACMCRAKVDGLLYQSAVYTVTGCMEGCNLVLFEGRIKQIQAINHQPLMIAVLPSGETPLEFLGSLGVVIV